MGKSLIEICWPLVTVLSDETVTKRQYRHLDLSADTWSLLSDLIKCLHPLEVATVLLCEENHNSLSLVLPVIHGLISQLVATEEDSALIRQFNPLPTNTPYGANIYFSQTTNVPYGADRVCSPFLFFSFHFSANICFYLGHCN